MARRRRLSAEWRRAAGPELRCGQETGLFVTGQTDRPALRAPRVTEAHQPAVTANPSFSHWPFTRQTSFLPAALSLGDLPLSAPVLPLRAAPAALGLHLRVPSTSPGSLSWSPVLPSSCDCLSKAGV